jgi:hypothetical membrane protein
MKPSTNKAFLLTGVFIPILFWTATFIAGQIHGDYNHFKNTISELGAIGTKSEQFMTVCTWLCTLLGIVFLVGLVTACSQLKLNKLPLIGVFGFSMMFGWAATFHSGNSLHSKSGPVLLLLLLGPILSLILWKGKELNNIRIWSLTSFLIMLLILLRVISSETIQNNYTGLIQRFVHLGWSIWFVTLSLGFLRLTSKK